MGRMTKDEANRLDRIEQKIDKLSEAIISLARAEEKIHNLEDTVGDALEKLSITEERIRAVESKSNENEQKLSAFSKFFWVMVTAVAAAVTGSITMFSGK
jgi:DNA repair exonuclease SbcCD ATPase subunit